MVRGLVSHPFLRYRLLSKRLYKSPVFMNEASSSLS